MVQNTGYIKYFDLVPYHYGFILVMPSKEEPRTIREFEPKDKLFATLSESTEWGRRLDLETVGALNDKIAQGEMSHLILIQEALQEKKIAEIAAQIASRRKCQVCDDRRPLLLWKDHIFPQAVGSAGGHRA